MKRRTFLKLSALCSASVAFGCNQEVDKTLFPMVKGPDDMVTGRSIWYASTCRECPGGCGILAKTREGRAVKIEGNPLHPVNKGKICMRGQAAVQGVYHPDRLTTPLLRDKGRYRKITYEAALDILREKTVRAADHGADRVRMLTELTGESLHVLFETVARRWNSGPPQIFEPLSCESLKSACYTLFGSGDLPEYRMREADLLISFGADFIETWLSPVSFARRFKEMHCGDGGTRGKFFHISSCQSLTAANADRWMCCRPGGKKAVAMWMIREMLEKGSGKDLPDDVREWLKTLSSPYTRAMVEEASGISAASLDSLLSNLMASSLPLVLGTETLPSGPDAAAVDMAALLLNLTLDPSLSLLDFRRGYRIGRAAGRAGVMDFFDRLVSEPADVLLLHRVNPLYALPTTPSVKAVFENDSLFIVDITNMMDDTARMADLVIPTALPLESWDEYGAREGLLSLLQPAMAPFTGAPHVGDVLLQTAFGNSPPVENYKTWLMGHLTERGLVTDEQTWIETLRRGGRFREMETRGEPAVETISVPSITRISRNRASDLLKPLQTVNAESTASDELVFLPTTSIRFHDGRSGDRPWMCEVPDPLTMVAWQTPVLMHPDTLRHLGIEHEAVAHIVSQWGELDATVYETEGVHPRVVAMPMGQGHVGSGRYANESGLNPLILAPGVPVQENGMAIFPEVSVSISKTGRMKTLAHTDGSRIMHGRKIALSVPVGEIAEPDTAAVEYGETGLSMNEFPMTLPLPEGYDPKRDFYPPHTHEGYRWSMVVDLDRCVGCAACAAACYAENNLGIVGEKHIIEGREMAWMRVERYQDMADATRISFLPMMCQHCDNAPCEPVCPVYAPHHSKEGLNNQIYNRCIGTRFCSQNCPYKVRRFNWFDWKWPEPLNRQLNPSVTVRSKGVMEKCSFCIQRIKEAHGVAKNEDRDIRDGEVKPACVQTCPTGALIFGNLMDKTSRVWKLVHDPRAYQVMGYVNTKPAVIYLKKVIRDI